MTWRRALILLGTLALFLVVSTVALEDLEIAEQRFGGGYGGYGRGFGGRGFGGGYGRGGYGGGYGRGGYGGYGGGFGGYGKK